MCITLCSADVSALLQIFIFSQSHSSQCSLHFLFFRIIPSLQHLLVYILTMKSCDPGMKYCHASTVAKQKR